MTKKKQKTHRDHWLDTFTSLGDSGVIELLIRGLLFLPRMVFRIVKHVWQ